MSRDPRQSRSLISPRGDCPVLFGIRSQSYDSALSAVERLVSAEQTQPVIAYRVFKTNQASDDHLDRIHKGVVKEIEILKRGHVNITLRDGSTLMAFKESGEVNKIAQQLIFGDVIHFLGLQVEPGVWHCEKIRASNLATRNRRRPKCECGQTYKSQGRNQPLRCPSCKSTTEATWIGDQHGGVDQSWKQAPADSRRHLSRPLEFGWAEHFEI